MKIGIMGNGKVVQMALEALSRAGITVRALWCRDSDNGHRIVDEHAISTLYTGKGSLDAFLQDKTFDVVYIGLINSLHYEYAKKAILAGKNVICEKPFTSTLLEAEELVDLAGKKNVFLFEAIMSRYSRNYEAIVKALPEIGDVRIVQSNYLQYSSRYDEYRRGNVLPVFDPEFTGGALYDLNVYNIHFVEGLFGSPKKVAYSANLGFNGIDTSGVACLDYGKFSAICIGAKDADDCGSKRNGSVIIGTDGWIEINDRPGHIHDVMLGKREGSIRKISVFEEQDSMATEFLRIQEVINNKDIDIMSKWLTSTLEVMKILNSARNDAGIVFGADR